MTGQEEPPEENKPFPLAYLFGGFGAIDLVAPMVLEAGRPPGLVTIGVFSGLVAAQLGLLSIWAVLGPHRFRYQYPATLFLTLALAFLILMAFIAVEGWDPSTGEPLNAILCLPLVSLAAQLPLWILRIGAGYRIVRIGAETDASPSRSSQFRIRDLLVATALLAAALGLARCGLPGREGASADELAGLMLICLFCAVYSTCSTFPCLWAAFVAPHKAAGAYVLTGYVVAMTFFVVVMTGVLPEFAVMFFIFHGVLAAVMLGVLHLARARGYVLHRARWPKVPGQPVEFPANGVDGRGE